MTDSTPSPRKLLVRNSLVFQLKLLADGLRDFALLPVSIVATVVGLIRSGENPEEEFEGVLEVGRKSEQWINLFGTHEPIHAAGDAGSIDRLITRAEEVVRDQTKKGGVSEGASEAISKALDSLHDKARITNKK